MSCQLQAAPGYERLDDSDQSSTCCASTQYAYAQLKKKWWFELAMALAAFAASFAVSYFTLSARVDSLKTQVDLLNVIMIQTASSLDRMSSSDIPRLENNIEVMHASVERVQTQVNGLNISLIEHQVSALRAQVATARWQVAQLSANVSGSLQLVASLRTLNDTLWRGEGSLSGSRRHGFACTDSLFWSSCNDSLV
jgi:hypothetical protein